MRFERIKWALSMHSMQIMSEKDREQRNKSNRMKLEREFEHGNKRCVLYKMKNPIPSSGSFVTASKRFIFALMIFTYSFDTHWNLHARKMRRAWKEQVNCKCCNRKMLNALWAMRVVLHGCIDRIYSRRLKVKFSTNYLLVEFITREVFLRIFLLGWSIHYQHLHRKVAF